MSTTALGIPVTATVKAAIRAHYKTVCQYCFGLGANDVEHIVPKAKGGANTLGNTTLACRQCNARKSDASLDPMFVSIAHTKARAAAPKIAMRLQDKRMTQVLTEFVGEMRGLYGADYATRLADLLLQRGRYTL